MVIMVCRTSACITFDVRLQDSLSLNRSGRVEMCGRSNWFNFCADNSSESLANVVCRQLGYCDEGGTVTLYFTLY